jgi:L-iditol 2-dehydrogenase
LKAAVFYGPRNIRLEERAKPKLADDSISIRVKWSSLCGTDNHIYRGNFDVKTPLILGHDFSGTVDEVGSKVTRLSVGDKVVAEPIRYCGTCPTCLKGRYTICENRAIMGIQIDGSLAKYVVAPEKNVFAIPNGVSFQEAATMEPAAVALHSMDYAKPVAGETVVILGQGPIGLLHTQVARISGLTVTAVDILDHRLELAKKLGADYAINPSKEDLVGKVRSFTNRGADIIIDTSGSVKTTEITPFLASPAGRIIVVGSSKELMTHGPPAEMILTKELSIYGVAGAPLKYPRALALVGNKKLDVKTLITHRIKLSMINEAFRLFDDPRMIKTLVESSG